MAMKPGFDRRNLSAYRLLLSFVGVVSAFIVITTMMGRPPGFATDAGVTIWAYAAAFAAAVVGYILIGSGRVPIIHAAMIPTLLFGAAGYASGLPRIAAWLIIGASLAVIVAALLLGERADLQSKTRTVKFRLPWR